MKYSTLILAHLMGLSALPGCAADGYKVHRIRSVDDKGAMQKLGQEGNPFVYYALPRSVVTISIPITRTTPTLATCTKKELEKEFERQPPPPAPTKKGEPAPAVPTAAERASDVLRALGIEPETTATAQKKIEPETTATAQKKVEPETTATAQKKVEPETTATAQKKVEPETTATAQKKVKFELGNPTFGLRQEADPDQMFAIEINDAVLRSNKRTFDFNEQGFLTAASLESSNKAVDVGIKTLEVAASIVGKFFGFGGKGGASRGRCLDLADKIHDIRRYRLEVVRGPATAGGMPKDTMELLLKEFDAQEKTLRDAFTGAKKEEQSTIVCEVFPTTPKKDEAETFTLFHLDGGKGISLAKPVEDKGNGLAKPDSVICVANAEFAPPDLKDGIKVSVELSPRARDLARAVGAAQRPQRDPGGIAYRIPAQAIARVLAGAKEIGRTRTEVAQYGAIAFLPDDSDSSNIGGTYTVKLSPTSGGLVSFASSSTSVDAAALGTIGGSVTTVLDAAKARKDASETADIDELEKAKKRLELRRDIQKLEDELGIHGD